MCLQGLALSGQVHSLRTSCSLNGNRRLPLAAKARSMSEGMIPASNWADQRAFWARASST